MSFEGGFNINVNSMRQLPIEQEELMALDTDQENEQYEEYKLGDGPIRVTRPQKKMRYKGQKNPNNPKELLHQSNKLFISKKANYVDCASCYCCIGENIYKVYRWKSKKQSELEEGEQDEVD